MDVIEGTAVDRGIHLLHLLPKAMTVQSYPLLVKRRGPYLLEGIKLLTRFPFGLFVKAATVPLQSEILVYPEVKPLPQVLLDDLSVLGRDQALSQRGQGTALHNLRLYQPGDDSRTIHWKTTARKSLLIVRETEAEDQRRVTIALQTAIPEGWSGLDCQEPFEKAVSLTASLAALFTERAYEIRLMIGEQELAYEMGEPHLDRMLSLLAVCRPTSDAYAGTTGLQRLAEPHANELIIHVLAWPNLQPAARQHRTSRVLIASEFL
jgi:uncharacterized protein (DUF58 family)